MARRQSRSKPETHIPTIEEVLTAFLDSRGTDVQCLISYLHHHLNTGDKDALGELDAAMMSLNNHINFRDYLSILDQVAAQAPIMSGNSPKDWLVAVPFRADELVQDVWSPLHLKEIEGRVAQYFGLAAGQVVALPQVISDLDDEVLDFYEWHQNLVSFCFPHNQARSLQPTAVRGDGWILLRLKAQEQEWAATHFPLLSRAITPQGEDKHSLGALTSGAEIFAPVFPFLALYDGYGSYMKRGILRQIAVSMEEHYVFAQEVQCIITGHYADGDVLELRCSLFEMQSLTGLKPMAAFCTNLLPTADISFLAQSLAADLDQRGIKVDLSVELRDDYEDGLLPALRDDEDNPYLLHPTGMYSLKNTERVNDFEPDPEGLVSHLDNLPPRSVH